MVASCSEFKEDLSAFLDGELDQEQQTVLAEHLLSCLGCRKQHEGYRQFGRILKESSEKASQSAPDLWEQLSGRVPSVCQCVQEDLSAYLDGELIAPAKEGVNLHLEACPTCLGKFQELSRVNNVLSTGLALPKAVEVDLWAGIKARLNDDCAVIEMELSPFIDKEVDTLRHRAITAHLTECASCTGKFNALAQSGDSLRSFYQPAIPDGFDLWPAIKSKLNVIPFDTNERRRNPVKVGRPLTAAAAVVVAGVVASSAFMFINQSASAPQVQPVTAEAYLIDQSLGDPAEITEPVVYEHTP